MMTNPTFYTKNKITLTSFKFLVHRCFNYARSVLIEGIKTLWNLIDKNLLKIIEEIVFQNSSSATRLKINI